MKKLLLSFVSLILITFCAFSEGLFPAYIDLFGVEMPSFSAVAHRVADYDTVLEDGSRSVKYMDATEDDFDAFSDYLDTFGCSLLDYSIQGSLFTATIEKQGSSFILIYDSAAQSIELIYPNGSVEEDISGYLYQVGDIYTFGHYEQDNVTSNGKEPIEWIIMEIKDDDSLVLISRYALDCKPYNSTYASVTWETCSLREWLNTDFYNAAFSNEEKAKIIATDVSADKNPKYNTPQGNNTRDKVYLLSITEVNNYFDSDGERMCAPTKYAVAQGAWQNDSYKVDGTGACWWWLRSSGDHSSLAARVGFVGGVSPSGSSVRDSDLAVRPVVCVQPS